jgi:hypothetical protein
VRQCGYHLDAVCRCHFATCKTEMAGRIRQACFCFTRSSISFEGSEEYGLGGKEDSTVRMFMDLKIIVIGDKWNSMWR